MTMFDTLGMFFRFIGWERCDELDQFLVTMFHEDKCSGISWLAVVTWLGSAPGMELMGCTAA